MRGLAALAFLATPVSAQEWPIPWDGYWRAPADSCEQASRFIGAETRSETVCHGVRARALATPGTWEVEMRCDDGGRIWQAPRIVMLYRDRMWIWFGPGGSAPLIFLRCEAGGDY